MHGQLTKYRISHRVRESMSMEIEHKYSGFDCGYQHKNHRYRWINHRKFGLNYTCQLGFLNQGFGWSREMTVKLNVFSNPTNTTIVLLEFVKI